MHWVPICATHFMVLLLAYSGNIFEYIVEKFVFDSKHDLHLIRDVRRVEECVGQCRCRRAKFTAAPQCICLLLLSDAIGSECTMDHAVTSSVRPIHLLFGFFSSIAVQCSVPYLNGRRKTPFTVECERADFFCLHCNFPTSATIQMKKKKKTKQPDTIKIICLSFNYDAIGVRVRAEWFVDLKSPLFPTSHFFLVRAFGSKFQSRNKVWKIGARVVFFQFSF